MNRFRPYFQYLKPYRAALFGSAVAAAVYGLAGGAGIPLLIHRILPKIFGETHYSLLQVAGYAALIPLLFLVRGIAGYLNTYLVSHSGIGALEALRRDVFSKLQHLPLAYFNRNASGDLLARVVADTQQLQQTLIAVTNDLIKQPVTLLGAVGVLTYQAVENRDVVYLLACLAVIPASVFPVRFFGRKLLRRAHENQMVTGALAEGVAENLAAVREVRAFGLQDQEREKFFRTSRSLFRSQLKVVKYTHLLSPTIEVLSAVGIAFSFFYAYYARLPWETFFAIVGALFMCYEPIKRIGAMHNQMQKGLGSAQRIEEVLHEPVSIADPPDPVPVQRLEGCIEFRDVDFSYGSGAALLGVSVCIPPGTVCALVGPSGAGKTTFANLVPRFYDATAGSVTVDGIDVRRMRLDDLRRNIGIVSQDPVLFNDTVFNNILIGKLDASREEVMAACRRAYAHEFVSALPQGYDTVVGERGILLSGGQKQRLAIARAFLRNPPILILDEATSALDSQSEQMVQDALRNLVAGKTVLIIAHRFSTIRDAGLILVFDQGRVVSSGNHRDLYAAAPLYRDLYDRQH